MKAQGVKKNLDKDSWKNASLCLQKSILLATFGQGGLVFDVRTRASFLVNHTGAKILELMDGKKRGDEILQTFGSGFEEDKEAVGKDVERFMEDIIERGWIDVQ